MRIVDVTPDNVLQYKLFCSRNAESEGFKGKTVWFKDQYALGLRMKILYDDEENQVGFIEYTPGEHAWRPVKAKGFMFVHCMYIYREKHKAKGYGSKLLVACEEDAISRGMAGLCAMSSRGAWMADRRIYEKNGFSEVESHDRFVLVMKKWSDHAPDPKLRDWESNLDIYEGWHLLYSDQCPWHDKAVKVLQKTAQEFNIELNVHKLTKPVEAQYSPSGFGVFSLVRDGRLLEDHYISETRFRNILKVELLN